MLRVYFFATSFLMRDWVLVLVRVKVCTSDINLKVIQDRVVLFEHIEILLCEGIRCTPKGRISRLVGGSIRIIFRSF